MNLLHIHKFFATPMSSTSLETKVKHIQDYYEALHTYTLSRRFRKSDLDYTYEVLYLKPMSLYDAVILEQSLLNIHSEFKYTPLLKFAGHTECLSYFNTKTLP